jgi:hypothetical protein
MTDGKPIDHNLEFLSVLGLTQPVTVEDVKQAYLEKAKTAHPDRGGDKQEFVRLQQAFEQATEYAQFKAGRMQWLTRWVEQYAEQQAVIDEIKALGGIVEVKADDTLTRSIGPDFATVLDRVVKIRLAGARVDDRTLLSVTSHRRVLAGLRHLELIDTSVSSVGLKNLQVFESLQHLDLSGTAVSELALDSLLADLKQLETLNLSQTGVGWWARKKLRFTHRDLQIVG